MYCVARSLLLAALVASCGCSAAAQTVDYTLYSVLDRPRPDTAPLGARVGSFVFTPALLSSVAFDDNIYATKGARAADTVARLRPSFLLRSDWRVHSLEIFGDAETVRYRRHAAEDHADARLGLRGVIEAQRGFEIGYRASWLRQHDDRGANDGFSFALPFDKPVAHDRLEAGLSLNKRFGRLTASLAEDFAAVRYGDNSILGNRVALSARDFASLATRGRLGFDLTAITQLFGEVAFESRRFRARQADSLGLRAVAGLRFEASRRVNGEFFAGYLGRSFARTGPSDIHTYTYGGNLSWLTTPLLTLTLLGRRDTQESYDGATLGAYIQSTAELRADYELRRNLIVSTRLGLEQDDFRAAQRRDRFAALSASVSYAINRALQVSLDCRFVRRVSDVSAANYSRNIFGASLRAQY